MVNFWSAQQNYFLSSFAPLRENLISRKGAEENLKRWMAKL
jgi:hypothetical protein